MNKLIFVRSAFPANYIFGEKEEFSLFLNTKDIAYIVPWSHPQGDDSGHLNGYMILVNGYLSRRNNGTVRTQERYYITFEEYQNIRNQINA